jgi:protein phosphatase
MIKFAAVTSIGVCQKNDDRAMVNGQVISDGAIEGAAEHEIIATICDGVGGYAFGDEAAEISSKVFADVFGTEVIEQIIETAVTAANSNVLAAQETDADHRNMSSTVAGVYIKGGDFIVFNVGDSRVLRLRNSYLSQLSVDHSFSQESVSLGLVKSSDEIDEKDRHTITRYIGDNIRCRPSITVGEKRVFDGDVFIICSDGLSDVVTGDTMENILNERADLSACCEKLILTSLQNNSRDNISVILLEVS